MDSHPVPKTLLPDSPASRQLTAWLNAFNIPGPETLLAYHKEYFPYDVASFDVKSIDQETALLQATGGFDIIDVLKLPDSDEKFTESSLHVIMQERRRKMYARALIRVDPHVDGNPVTKFDINSTNIPIKYYQRALQALTPELRRTIVRDISIVVRNQYIFPVIGEKMIRDLNAKAQDGGEYEDHQDAELFAQRLTSDMLAISRNMHIRVLVREPPPPGNGGDKNDAKTPKEAFDVVRKSNFGFGDTSIESIGDKKIRFLPIHGFVPSGPKYASDFAAVREAISDILTKVAQTDALLIDLRTNRGGHPDTVAFILSYLLGDGPVHLLDIVDRNGTIKNTFSTLPVSDLLKGALRFGGLKPLFVLTSKNTISGGEDMAYGLQAFGRANAVIGEDQTTAGAANPVMNPKFIGEEEFGRRGVWGGMVSVTGLNWEGVGVKSDIEVSGGQGNAKDLGRRMALEVLGVDGLAGI